MPRSKKVPKAVEVLAPVPDAILNQFAAEGMLTAADQSSQWLEREDRAH